MHPVQNGEAGSGDQLRPRRDRRRESDSFTGKSEG